jgi:hypothetical protein
LAVERARSSARIAKFLVERKGLLLALVAIHAFVIHYFLLGFVSWDGLTYRVPPIIELIQSGGFGLSKYNQWAFAGYVPFVELSQYPFLLLFKLQGILIGWPLVVFPLAVAVIYRFVREAANDELAGVLGALSFAALPFVNQQPFSGYVDFIVCAVLAFFLYAGLRLNTNERPLKSFARFTAASLLLAMARSQGVYVGALFLPILFSITCVRWEGRRPRQIDGRRAASLVGGFGIGAIPSIATQIWRFKNFSSPMAPFRLELPGITIGQGLSRADLFAFGGLESETVSAYVRAFLGAWVWPRYWPLGGFFDSRNMGGGFLFCVAVVLLPVFLRSADRRAVVLGIALALVSVLIREFWLPRYAYCFVLALVLALGSGLSRVATMGGASWRFVVPLLFVALHFFRPEFEIATLAGGIGPRLNVAESRFFLESGDTIDLVPDRHAKFVILETTTRGFLVQLYGPKLTNQVVGTIPAAKVGPACEGLRDARDVLYVDDQDLTRACPRECAIPGPHGRCVAFRLTEQP